MDDEREELQLSLAKLQRERQEFWDQGSENTRLRGKLKEALELCSRLRRMPVCFNTSCIIGCHEREQCPENIVKQLRRALEA